MKKDNKRAIKKVLREWKKQGLSKSAIFECATEKEFDVSLVTTFLSNYPNKEDVLKYGYLNKILIIIYVLFLLLTIFTSLDLLPGDIELKHLILIYSLVLFFDALFIYWIATYNPNGYKWLVLFYTYQSFKDYSGTDDDLYGIVLMLAFFCFLYIVKKRIFPYQNFLHIKGIGKHYYFE